MHEWQWPSKTTTYTLGRVEIKTALRSDMSARCSSIASDFNPISVLFWCCSLDPSSRDCFYEPFCLRTTSCIITTLRTSTSISAFHVFVSM